jgi:hypothetical protein
MGLAKIEVAVDATVRALLREVAGLGVDQRQRPFLELEALFRILAPAPGEIAGPAQVLRHAMGGEGDRGEGVAQPLLDQADGEMGHVDADPAPPEFLRRMDLAAGSERGAERRGASGRSAGGVHAAAPAPLAWPRAQAQNALGLKPQSPRAIS